MVSLPSIDGVWAAVQAEGGGRIHVRWAGSKPFLFRLFSAGAFRWVYLVVVSLAALWVAEKGCWHPVLEAAVILPCDLRFPCTGPWFPQCRMIPLQPCHRGPAHEQDVTWTPCPQAVKSTGFRVRLLGFRSCSTACWL